MTEGDGMANIERWTIHPARRIKHDDGISMALGRVDPRPETDSEPFEVVRADAYLGAVEALQQVRDQLSRIDGPAEREDGAARAFVIAVEALDRFGGQ